MARTEEDGIRRTLARWKERHGLSHGECAVLLLAAEGHTLLHIAHLRGTSVDTVRKQSETLRAKTLDDSLALSANRLLAEARELP